MKAVKIEKTNKKVKQPKTKFEKGCLATLIIQAVFVGLAFTLLLLTPIVILYGGLVFMFFVISAIVWSIGSFGIGWYIPEVREFFSNTWKYMENVFNSAESIKEAIHPHVAWLAVVLFIISLSGFICNTIYYFKKDKKNKGLFITSCVLAAVGLIIMVLTIILHYAK